MDEFGWTEADGYISINGEKITDSIRVSFNTKFGLTVGCKQKHIKKHLQIYTFNQAMINALDHRCISEPINYKIEGTKLGGFAEIFDQREGDIDFRVIKHIEICITYSKSSVKYEISGLATVKDGHVKHSQEDWIFDVEFTVARINIPEFYRIGEDNFLIEAIDNL